MKYLIFLFSTVLLLNATSGCALTASQVLEVCDNNFQHCATKTPIYYYLGGMLDALGHENSERKLKGGKLLYCRTEKEMHDFTAMLTWINQQSAALKGQNMTVAVLQYLDEYGNCQTMNERP